MTYSLFSNRIKRCLGIFAVALSSQAAIAADTWQINPVGSGVAAASSVSTVNVGGVGFVQVIPDANNPYAFTFLEHGAYQALNGDGSAPFGANDLTVTYSVSGFGNFLDPSALHMTAGQINLYSDPLFDFATSAANYGADNGKLVASFNIFDGYVANSQGMVTVKASGIANSFSQGYLFNADGTDMASLSNVQLLLNITNQVSTPDNLIIAGIVCGLAAACDNGLALSPQAFTVEDSGSVSILAVPEPETLSMLLAGLGLIAGLSRRRRKAAR